MIDCAMKRTPCDLVFRGGKIFNVYTGELEEKELAVANGKIVAIGEGYEGETVDCTGKVLLPGFIDAHLHVESTLLSPEAFSFLASAHGTTGIVADPHEITNVCGIEGAEYVAEAFSRLRYREVVPIDVYLQLPSCVPATPFETSGAKIDGKETAKEIAKPLFHGLGEMMNFPAVMAGEEDCLTKLIAAKEAGKTVDGHAPALSNEGLCAYLCAGIVTDHEALDAKECAEKVARGMYCQLRNGSSAKNLEENAKAMTEFNFSRFLLCSDDKNADDLYNHGHIDDALRRLVACGIPAKWAICTATRNVSECYGLRTKGALSPGFDADIAVVDDVQSFCVRAVYKNGVKVAQDGHALFESSKRYLPRSVQNTVHVKEVAEDDFRITLKGDLVRAMKVLPHSLVTESVTATVNRKDGDVRLEGTDLCKLAVVERHFASGNIGLCLVQGYGLKGGAIGITVAHDSHNLVVLGDNNADMVRVVSLLKEAGGGMALVCGEKEEVFPLDIAGLMSSASVEEVRLHTARITKEAYRMGVKDYYEPFMTLAFLALPVIPHLKLTDRGLFDVDAFAFTPLEI